MGIRRKQKIKLNEAQVVGKMQEKLEA